MPGIAATVNLDHVRRGYHSIRALDPSGIVPTGPVDPRGLDRPPRAGRRAAWPTVRSAA